MGAQIRQSRSLQLVVTAFELIGGLHSGAHEPCECRYCSVSTSGAAISPVFGRRKRAIGQWPYSDRVLFCIFRYATMTHVRANDLGLPDAENAGEVGCGRVFRGADACPIRE